MISKISKMKKKILIPEEKFQHDFKPLAGFFDYHVKSKNIKIPLEKFQEFGVNLIPQKPPKMAKIPQKDVAINSIVFSSSRKSNNVKNLAWYIRCLVSHPENISIDNMDGKACYRLYCSKKVDNKDDYSITMQGLVDCEIWAEFAKKWMNTILELSENYE